MYTEIFPPNLRNADNLKRATRHYQPHNPFRVGGKRCVNKNGRESRKLRLIEVSY